MSLRKSVSLAVAGSAAIGLFVLGAGPASATENHTDAAAAASSKCARLLPSTAWKKGHGSDYADICWNWFRRSDGKFSGTYSGKWHKVSHNTHSMYLQANIDGKRWVSVRKAPAEVAVGVPFSGDFDGFKHITFRVCITGEGCGSAPA